MVIPVSATGVQGLEPVECVSMLNELLEGRPEVLSQLIVVVEAPKFVAGEATL